MFTMLHKLIPKLETFPEVTSRGKIGVLVRLFPKANRIIQESDLTVLNIALWSMRSHFLNSDLKSFDTQLVFHIKELFYPIAEPILRNYGIPKECILEYPNDLCSIKTSHPRYHWNAAAPLLDTQLDDFELIIVIDADTFTLCPIGALPLPLVELSSQKFPQDTFTVATTWDTGGIPYIGWWAGLIPMDKFIDTAAHWAECSPETFRSIMMAPDVLKPVLNALYINLPMQWLRGNSEFRQYIHDCSAETGNEEIALSIWALRHFLKTGEQLPKYSLFTEAVYAHDFSTIWQKYQKVQSPSILHGSNLNGIRDYAREFATAIGATPNEADKLVENAERYY